MMILREKRSRLAIITSILLHIILLSIFILIKLNITIDFPEFTEILFVSGKNRFAVIPTTKETAQPFTSLDNQEEQASAIVKLPIRKMAEEEKPQLKVVNQAKQVPDDDIQTIPEIEHLNNRKELIDALLRNPSNGEKVTAMPTTSVSPDEKLFPTTSIATESSGQTPYQIEGQAASRTVVYKVIPQYPENLQKQAMIKIRFTVLANGHVGEMIPVIKSDAQLEKITLDALRQWQFNPLPAEAPQHVERGVITFRYLLR